MKLNCWEVKKCGRQRGGDKVSELGECPAACSFVTHGVNNGINGGRACWVVAGTFCEGKQQGTFVNKIRGCSSCDFFHMVVKEEGGDFATVPRILEKISAGRN